MELPLAEPAVHHWSYFVHIGTSHPLVEETKSDDNDSIIFLHIL